MLALTSLSEMFSHSDLRKKLDGTHESGFASLVNTWALGMADLTREDVERGLQSVLNSGMEFEPSLPAFVKRCKPQAHAYPCRTLAD